MVTQRNKNRSRRGVLEVDMLIAMALLLGAAIPLMCTFASDARALRQGYNRAVAMECVDGELEVLAAGAWRQQPLGTNEITLSGTAVHNLRPPTATVIRRPDSIRVEWRPASNRSVCIAREVKLQ